MGRLTCVALLVVGVFACAALSVRLEPPSSSSLKNDAPIPNGGGVVNPAETRAASDGIVSRGFSGSPAGGVHSEIGKFNLPAGLSNPDAKGKSRFRTGLGGGYVAGEHGRMIPRSGSAIVREIGEVKAKEWEVKHGFVDDPITAKDGLEDAYAFKRVPVVNTDTAVKKALSPQHYNEKLTRGEMDPADLRGMHKYTDSTIPSTSDPAGRDPAAAYNPGDPRITLESFAPSDRFRGEHDPQAKEIRRRNKMLRTKLSIYSIPEHKDVKVANLGDGTDGKDRSDWDSMTAGLQDTGMSKVTDPAILGTTGAKAALSNTFEDTADPGSGNMEGIPSFDQGMHQNEATEFKDPSYFHGKGTTTKYIRAASEVPFDEKQSNFQGLMVTQPVSDSLNGK